VSGPATRRAASVAISLLGLFLSSAAAACTLVEVGPGDKPLHRVYFTRFATEDNTGGKFKHCKIVKKPTPEAETFTVTPYRQDATDIVHKTNWPG
jgi:hypothetical protein